MVIRRILTGEPGDLPSGRSRRARKLRLERLKDNPLAFVELYDAVAQADAFWSFKDFSDQNHALYRTVWMIGSI